MIFFFGELSQQICQEHDSDTYRPGCFFPSVFALLSALMLSPLGGGFVMSSWHLLRYQQFLLRMGLALNFFGFMRLILKRLCVFRPGPFNSEDRRVVEENYLAYRERYNRCLDKFVNLVKLLIEIVYR